MAVAHGRSQHEAPAELAPVPPDTSLESVMFDLILKFLQTPGQVLLVQGPPGSGKTTFALEILNQVLRLKHSKQRAVLVVDSWEGAIRNTNDEGRKMLESAVLSELDESKVSVVIVVEDSKKAGDLGYLVDGIVTLDQSELDGRRVRTIAMNKLRGFSVPTKRGIFSLDKARFTILPNGLRTPRINLHPKPLEPVPHPPHAFSLGSKDMDQMLGGSIPRGSFLLIDVDSSVSPIEIRTILNMVRANFINQKGPCVIVPTAAYSSDTVAESLSKYVGW